MNISSIFRLFAISLLLSVSSCGSTLGQSRGSYDASSSRTGSGKSVRAWVSCSGTSDDTAGFTKALAAAAHGAFTLIVDCPVNIKVGMDISRSIFIDDGTTVEFTGAGKITVDNTFVPAFVIADSNNITLINWNVEYDAGLPPDVQTGGYVNHGEFVHGPKPANAFNDLRLTGWLAANRGITFDRRQGAVFALWSGPTNASAVFFITGDSSKLTVTGMRMYVPANAGGERFIPVAFTVGANPKRNQTVVSNMPMTSQSYAVPHDLIFSNISLDGTYMGWVGGLRDAVFENIQSQRYGDLQDAQGGAVGGVGKWFAPPHLFYLSFNASGDAGLFNENVRIKNVVDSGVRIGKARDAGKGDTLSGYCLSIKIGCVNCSVDNYKSARPDGFLDVLDSDGLTISNATATYDSSFLNDVFPGWRFPHHSYKNVKFENITLIDTAPASVQPPMASANQATNQGIVVKNVHLEINRWAGPGSLPLPTIAGQAHDVSLDMSVKSEASRIVMAQTGAMAITLKATPASLRVGSATALTWTARQPAHCGASGAWSGTLEASGSRTLPMTAPGNNDFILTCQNAANESTTATVNVAVSP